MTSPPRARSTTASPGPADFTTRPTTDADRRLRRIVYACFLLSGAAGLIYEVVWARQLALFLGITTYATTAVITAYMIGLAAGSLAWGRVADRRRDHLRLYALLEVGIGAYAGLTPWLIRTIQNLYAGTAGGLGITGAPSHLLRFSLALLALLIPTFLMGGTLPLLVRGLTKSLPDLAAVTGRLYGINTLGATLGAFAAGFVLLPALGIPGTISVAVLLNVGVAVTIWVVGRRLEPTRDGVSPSSPVPANAASASAESPAQDALTPWAGRALLVGFAISGFAALIYQIAWIRALTLVVGASVYAFAITLTTYLAGLGLGSLLYVRFLARDRQATASRRLGQAAAMEVVIGLSAALGLPLIGLLPDLFLAGYRVGFADHFAAFQLFIFGLCFLIMFVPTLLLGALFPLITSLWARDARAMGRGVGTAYAANTAGTIFGSLLGGLLLLPTLGVQRSLLLAAGLHVAVGAAFWLFRPGVRSPLLRYGVAAAALLTFGAATILIPPWDAALMMSGVFYNADHLAQLPVGRSIRAEANSADQLYYAEGIDGVVSVKEAENQRFLVINGKTDASSKGDLATQVLLGQLPLLVHPAPHRVMVIGLGSGITAGSAATHANVEAINVLEISPEVVVASDYFRPENGDVLDDPRVNLILADARNFIQADPRTYDVIISEPSNPWISGISNLFTREAFELAKSRLAPGGVMAQWFHVYNMSPEDLKSVFETFQTVFPHVTVWEPRIGDLILLGTEQPHALDYERWQAALAQPAIRQDLARIAMDQPRKLVETFVFGGDALASYTARARLNTDNRPRIEFDAPRNLYAETVRENVRAMAEHVRGQQNEAPVRNLATRTATGFAAPAMGFTVEAPATVDNDWAALWLVQRQFVEGETTAADGLGVGSRLLLDWREDGHPTQVQVLWQETEPSAAQQQVFVEQALPRGNLIQGGLVDLHGKRQGHWILAASAEPGQIEFALTWTCPAAAGGTNRYLALHRLPDPGEAGWRAALVDLAGRFRCEE